MVKTQDFIIPAVVVGGFYLLSKQFREGINEVSGGLGDVFSGTGTAFQGLGSGLSQASRGLGSGIGDIGLNVGGFTAPLGAFGQEASSLIQQSSEQERALRTATFPTRERGVIERANIKERFKTELTRTIFNPIEASVRAIRNLRFIRGETILTKQERENPQGVLPQSSRNLRISGRGTSGKRTSTSQQSLNISKNRNLKVLTPKSTFNVIKSNVSRFISNIKSRLRK